MMMKGEEVDVDMVDFDENVTLDPASEDLKEARRLNKLAISYHDQGKLVEAKSALERALTTGQNILGSKDPEIATWLCNLGSVLLDMGDKENALKLHLLALQIDVQFYGSNDPHVATDLGNIAETFNALSRNDDAYRLIERAIEIDKKFLGTDHPDAATRLNILASIYKAKGMYGDAAIYYQRALEIYTNYYGRDHPDVATAQSNLASVQGKTKESEERISALTFSDNSKENHDLHVSETVIASDVHKLNLQKYPRFSIENMKMMTEEERTELYNIVLYKKDENKDDIRCLKKLLEQCEDKSKYVPMKFSLTGHKDIEIPSPLFIAFALGKEEMALKLVHCNFSLNQTDANGHTPIHYAAAYDQINILEKMWECYKEKFEWTAFRARDNQGRNAVGIRKAVHEGTLKLLLSGLIAELQDEGAIFDKLEQRKANTTSFFEKTCKLLKSDTPTHPISMDCGEQDTPTKPTPVTVSEDNPERDRRSND